MIAQLNNYLYIISRNNGKYIFYFYFVSLCVQISPLDMVLYKYSKGVDLMTINHEN